MLPTVWLALGGLLYSLQLSSGGFPKPLEPEEEQHYLTLAAQGDLEARNILIERNLRLVAHIMKKYYAQESDQEDLISIGTIGLIKAVSTYQMDKHIRLATYASRCIENSILTPWNSGMGSAVSFSFWILNDGQGSQIRSIRSRTGLSQKEFAEKSGIPIKRLRVWENEAKIISYRSWETFFK